MIEIQLDAMGRQRGCREKELICSTTSCGVIRECNQHIGRKSTGIKQNACIKMTPVCLKAFLDCSAFDSVAHNSNRRPPYVWWTV